MKNLIKLTLTILISFSLLACTNNAESKIIGTNSNKEIVSPINYGEGVYYFKANGKQFGESLSSFLKKENKIALSISGDGTGAYGADRGYFVILKDKD